MTNAELSQLAASLYDARIQAKPCAPLTERSSLTLEQAYAVSEINLNRRIQQENVKLIGKKIGLTSKAVQNQLGVKEPDFGYLTSDMDVPHGGTVQTKLIQGRVEGEVAFVLKKSLKGPGITAAQVIQATDFVLPCIEIIDSRVENWKIKIQDTVADNASSALFVLGNSPVLLNKIDLRLTGMSLSVNGEIMSTGVGAACLDHPVNAVTWLANKMGSLGVSLEAGDIILAGAFGPVVPIKSGDRAEVSFSGMSTVNCFFA